MAGTSMQQRRDPAATWAANNPVLKAGEIGYTSDTKIVKFGDGLTPWNSLPSIGYMDLANVKEAPVGGSLPIRTADGTIRAVGADEDNEVVILSQLSIYGRDRGTGATWPLANTSRRGDTFYHTSVAQVGIYDGAAWRLIAPGRIGTTAQRDALSWAYAGLQVWVTADGKLYEYQNAFLGWTRPWGDAWGELSSSTLVMGQASTAAYVEYGWTQIPIPKGRKLRLRVQSFWYTGGAAITIRNRLMVYRDNNATASTLVLTGVDVDKRVGGAYGDLAYFVFDSPYTTAGALGGSVNTRLALQAMYAGGTPSSALVTAGTVEQNFLYIEDMGPATPPPTV